MGVEVEPAEPVHADSQQQHQCRPRVADDETDDCGNGGRNHQCGAYSVQGTEHTLRLRHVPAMSCQSGPDASSGSPCGHSAAGRGFLCSVLRRTCRPDGYRADGGADFDHCEWIRAGGVINDFQFTHDHDPPVRSARGLGCAQWGANGCDDSHRRHDRGAHTVW